MCASAQTPTSRKLNAESREVYRRNIVLLCIITRKTKNYSQDASSSKRQQKARFPYWVPLLWPVRLSYCRLLKLLLLVAKAVVADFVRVAVAALERVAVCVRAVVVAKVHVAVCARVAVAVLAHAEAEAINSRRWQ